MNKSCLATLTMICLMSFSPSFASAQDAMKAQAPAWFKQADRNADGNLSRDEAPNKDVFGDVDTDQDGFASLSEVNTWLSTRPASNASPNNQPPQARRDDAGVAMEQSGNRTQLPENV